MNLDPTVSPWIGIVASTGVCCWMAVIGLPLSHAVFGDRPRPVWPFFAPAIGIVAVLLATNLSAYVIPGAPSAWFGLLAPSALAALVAWRGGWISRPSHGAAVASMALLAGSAGACVLAFAHQTQLRHPEETWHFALVQRMARGVFPPVTPYGQDAGIGYHYGPDLLAASIVNLVGVPPWTAMAVLSSLVIVALMMAAAGFAWGVGAPLPLAIGTGLVIGLVVHPIQVGLPPYVSTQSQSEGLSGLIAGLAPTDAGPAFEWLHKPHQALAVSIVFLVAAALDTGTGRRQAALIAVAAGVSGLAEAAVFIFAAAGLGLVGLVRLARLRGRQRTPLAVALGVAALLAVLAGGPASDAVLQRGGQAGMVRIAFEPPAATLALFDRAGPALVHVGITLLIALSGLAAYRRRSWGLTYLTAACAFGVVEAVFVQSALPFNDGRILFLAKATAAVAALAGISSLIRRPRGWLRNLSIAAIILLAILPTVVPRVTAGLRLAVDEGFAVGQPVLQGVGYPYVGQTRLDRELDENWDFYAELANALPNESRLLTPRPVAATSLAGIAAPTSGRGLQVISSSTTAVYEDALRFLHRDDLRNMAITHLHLTEAWEAVLPRPARHALNDPAQFRLLADRRSVSGQRHRVFEVLAGAGTLDLDPASYRSLRELVPADAPLVVLEGLTSHQSRMLLFNLIDQADLRASSTDFVQSAIRIPRVQAIDDIPGQGVAALLDHVEPTTLGLSRDDAVWAGYGMRVYDLASAWSPVWRIAAEVAELPAPLRRVCDASNDGQLELRLLGDPGIAVTAGISDIELSGTPQVTSLTVRDCRKLAFAAHAAVAPFAQVRSARFDRFHDSPPQVAGLGFDGGTDGNLAIVNLWYRNPHRLPITSGTEFRLYLAGPSGAVPRETDPRESIWWWSAPLTLAVDTQTARIEFDPERLTINGDPGVKSAETVPGRTYLLALNVARFNPETSSLWIQQVIPLVRIEVRDSGISSQVLSGIAGIQHREIGAPSRWLDYDGDIGWEIDLTPWPEAHEAST